MNKISNVSKGEQVSLFNNIAIETSAKCNRHCYFCPNDYFKRPDEYMPIDMFNKIVAELKSLKYKGRVELYIYNEPTRDKRLKELIKHVRAELPSSCIMISTNGDYLYSANNILDLLECGLNQMLINVYSANDKSLDKRIFESGVVKSEKRYEMFLQHVDTLTAWGAITPELSVYHNIGPNKRTVSVAKKFGVQRTSTTEGTDFDHLSNRSGLVPGFHSELKEPLVKHCTKPFRFLNINWNGEAMVCCNDFNAETKMGNVNDMSLVDIWNGERFNTYRLRLQNKNRNQFLCSGCDSNGGYYPHMVNKVTFGTAKDKEIMSAGYLDLKG